jgi:hypothetical protein
VQQWDSRFWAPSRGLNSFKDAHTKGMSTFEADEHLRGKSYAYFCL